jgi:hypothetical protein
LFIEESGQKLQYLFFIGCGLVGLGAISGHFRCKNGNSEMNLIAFLLIFPFTFYQYIQLARLKSLMAIELTLILLNV